MDAARALSFLPPALQDALWSASQVSPGRQRVCATGFAALDRELPGGGWPTHALTELLQPWPAPGTPLAEWRLLQPALARLAGKGQSLVFVGPPLVPHWPGLQQAGVPDPGVVWVQADSPHERLWATEQLIKGAGPARELAALVSWLPQATAAQVRRLQTWALQCDAPVFLVRPTQVAQQASAAPLRLRLQLQGPGRLGIEIIKRKGPLHASPLTLHAWPPGLAHWQHQAPAGIGQVGRTAIPTPTPAHAHARARAPAASPAPATANATHLAPITRLSSTPWPTEALPPTSATPSPDVEPHALVLADPRHA